MTSTGHGPIAGSAGGVFGDELVAAVHRLLGRVPAPAVAVGVTTRNRVLFADVAGTANLGTGEPVTRLHWWDLASLTKVLVTLPEVLNLVGQGRLRLSDALEKAWPHAAGTPVGAATVAKLLSHDAGLPSWLPYYKTVTDRADLLGQIVRTEAERPPGNGAVYSDIGFIALGEVITHLTGQPLDALATARGWVRYPPLHAPAVATERCAWRGRLLIGEVHDENARAMGGVAGHAGAFGTLDGVLTAARDWLAGRVVPPTIDAAARRCWSTGAQGERFGLGWRLTPWLGSALAAEDGYGLSGYVGNRLWIEPSRGYAVVVLSNRVHPQRCDRTPFDTWCSELFTTIGSQVSSNAASRTR